MTDSRVFSKQFISQAGLSGRGSSVTVPAGHVYLVRFVTVYVSAPLGPVATFFQDDSSGAALLAAGTDTNGFTRFWQECRFVFTENQGFHFQVDVSPGFTDHADVSASGYDLLA